MNPRLLVPIALANVVLVLAVTNFFVLRKNAVLENGRTVYLELLPRDPRSLIQGDYMVLRQAISRQAGEVEKKRSNRTDDPVPTRGTLILAVDGRGVATVDRFDSGSELAESEQRIRYRKWRRGFRFGLESFFFEEGDAGAFDRARYAEVKISEDGRPVLVGLRDGALEAIKP